MASENAAAKLDTIINEKYIPLDKKVKIVLAVALIAVPIVIFYFVFFAPNQKEISSLTDKKEKLDAEVTEAQAAADNLDQHKDALAAAQEKFEKIAEILPEKKEIPKLLRSISDLGKNAGLDFVSFKPGNEELKEFYAEIPLNIELLGPYHNIGYFLDQVSKLDRLVTVKNIKMASPKEEGTEMLLESSCNLLTYRFTGEPAPDAKKGPAAKKK